MAASLRVGSSPARIFLHLMNEPGNASRRRLMAEHMHLGAASERTASNWNSGIESRPAGFKVGSSGCFSVAANPGAGVQVNSAQSNGTQASGSQVNSFLSLLQQSSTSLANEFGPDPSGDSSADTTPTDRALKNNKGLNALLMSAAGASVAPSEAQPLPFRFSLNMFGAPRDSKNTRPQKSASASKDGPAPNDGMIPMPTAVPTPAAMTPVLVALAIPVPVPANSTGDTSAPAESAAPPASNQNATAGSIEPLAEQNTPSLDIDSSPIETSAPSELAFALRMQPTAQADPVAGQTDAAGGQLPVVASPNVNTPALTSRSYT